MVERAENCRWDHKKISLRDDMVPILEAYFNLPSSLDLESPDDQYAAMIDFESDDARRYDNIIGDHVWGLSTARSFSQTISVALNEFDQMERAGFSFHDLRALKIRHCRRTARTFMAWGEEGSADPAYQAARFGYAFCYYALSDFTAGMKTGACFGVIDSLTALGFQETALEVGQSFFGQNSYLMLAHPDQVSAILAQASRSVTILPGLVTLASLGQTGPDGKKVLN